LYPRMGAGGPTAKLVGKSAAYTWLFLARVTRPSAIRFIGILPSRSDGQSQDGSLSLPSGNCLAASKQRLHYWRCRNRPVLVSAPHRVSGACSRDGSHTRRLTSADRSSVSLAREHVIRSVPLLARQFCTRRIRVLKVMVRKFGWHRAFRIRNSALPRAEETGALVASPGNPAAGSGGALGDRLRAIAVAL